jgi:hypothetical protein
MIMRTSREHVCLGGKQIVPRGRYDQSEHVAALLFLNVVKSRSKEARCSLDFVPSN